MLLSSVKRILSVVIAAILIVPSTMTTFAESGDAEVDVLFPSDIPFRIIISERSKQGIVFSDEFEIVNIGDDNVAVEISAAKIQIENEDGYYISDTRELPETGSNIFIELICLDNQESSPIVMTDTPSEVVHTYNLNGGEVGKFKFDGAVNEIDGPSWGDTVVRIQISINIVGAELVASDEDQPSETEEAKEIANAGFDMDESTDIEAGAPAQEPAHDSTDTVDEDDTNNTNSTYDMNAQENPAGIGTDIEEPGHNANDSANSAKPISGQSSTEPAH